jgi:hypothetical protein
MRRALLTTISALALLALSASSALAHDGGEGLYGETNDKVVTNAGFILIGAIPLLILILTLIQIRLEKRKEEKMLAAKARRMHADLRGGW